MMPFMSHCQWVEEWSYSVDLSGVRFYDVLEDGNGDLLLVGNQPDFQDWRYYTVKLTEVGDEIWTMGEGEGEELSARVISRAYNGDFIVAGTRRTAPTWDSDFALKRMKGDGSIVWQTSFSSTSDDRLYSMVQLSDSSFLLGGVAEWNQAADGTQDMQLTRVAVDGTIIWTKRIDLEHSTSAEQVMALEDGGFIVAGYVGHSESALSSAYLARYDSQGDTVWTRAYSLPDLSLSFRGATLTSEGHIVATGSAEFEEEQGDDVYLELNTQVKKIDLDGNLIWETTIDRTLGCSAMEMADGNLLIGRYSSGFSILSSSGEEVYTHNLELPNGLLVNNVVETQNGDVLVVGNDYRGSPLLMRLGLAPLNQDEAPDDLISDRIRSVPTLVSDRSFITFSNRDAKPLDIVIFNSFGAIVRTYSAVTGESVVFEAQGLMDGMYIVQLVDGDKVIGTNRLVVRGAE